MAVLVALPTWLLVGETLSRAVRVHRRDIQHLRDLFDAARRLTACSTEAGAAATAAAIVGDMLQADIVEVMVAEEAGGQRFVSRGALNHPVGMGDIVIDAATETTATGRCVALGEPLFFPDSTGVDDLSARLVAATDARSLLFMPLPGEGGFLGTICVIWKQPQVRLSDDVVEIIEMISTETGKVLERTRATARLADEAGTDALTGLANRRAFDRVLDRLKVGDAVAIIDLDHFKLVNDTYGHPVGDDVLRELARCLTHVTRQADVVARYGGEEFAMVMHQAGVAGAKHTLHRLREEWDRNAPMTTFSAGVAVQVAGAKPRASLIAADAALYVAKQNGRDRTHFHNARRPQAAPS